MTLQLLGSSVEFYSFQGLWHLLGCRCSDGKGSGAQGVQRGRSQEPWLGGAAAGRSRVSRPGGVQSRPSPSKTSSFFSTVCKLDSVWEGGGERGAGQGSGREQESWCRATEVRSLKPHQGTGSLPRHLHS